MSGRGAAELGSVLPVAADAAALRRRMARARLHPPAPRPPSGAAARTVVSGAGRGVLGGSVLLVGGGWAAGYPEPVLLGLAGLLALAVAVAWVLPEAGVVAARSLAPASSVRGGYTTATVTVTRVGRRARRDLRLSDGCVGRRVDLRVPLPRPGQDRVVRYRVPTPRRGRVEVGPLEIVVGDPFGLCRRVYRFEAVTELVVRPRTVVLPAPPSGRDRHPDGSSWQAVLGVASEFHALRPYAPGDDARLVHWRSSARSGSLVVRQMADVSLPRTTVLLDTGQGDSPSGDRNPTAWSELFELAVDVCAAVACAAVSAGFPVRMVADGRTIGDGADAGPLLDALAGVEPGEASGLARAVAEVSRGRGGGTLVVVTTAEAAAASRAVAPVVRKFDRTIVIRTAPRPVGAGPAPTGARPPGTAVVAVADLVDLPALWDRAARG